MRLWLSREELLLLQHSNLFPIEHCPEDVPEAIALELSDGEYSLLLDSGIINVYVSGIAVNNCREEVAFRLQDGRSIRSIQELADSLRTASGDCFLHHTSGRNDFASWIEDVFGCRELAEEVRSAQNKEELVALLGSK